MIEIGSYIFVRPTNDTVAWKARVNRIVVSQKCIPTQLCVSWVYSRQDLEKVLKVSMHTGTGEVFMTDHGDCISIDSFAGLAQISEGASAMCEWWDKFYSFERQEWDEERCKHTD